MPYPRLNKKRRLYWRQLYRISKAATSMQVLILGYLATTEIGERTHPEVHLFVPLNTRKMGIMRYIVPREKRGDFLLHITAHSQAFPSDFIRLRISEPMRFNIWIFQSVKRNQSSTWKLPEYSLSDHIIPLTVPDRILRWRQHVAVEGPA